MHVLVTGGTGFVGAHSVGALIDAGHDVRLLVRAPERVALALDPLGVGRVDHVVGDVTDPVAVRGALEGCDAVLHAASVYALSQRRAAEIRSPGCRDPVGQRARYGGSPWRCGGARVGSDRPCLELRCTAAATRRRRPDCRRPGRTSRGPVRALEGRLGVDRAPVSAAGGARDDHAAGCHLGATRSAHGRERTDSDDDPARSNADRSARADGDRRRPRRCECPRGSDAARAGPAALPAGGGRCHVRRSHRDGATGHGAPASGRGRPEGAGPSCDRCAPERARRIGRPVVRDAGRTV